KAPLWEPVICAWGAFARRLHRLAHAPAYYENVHRVHRRAAYGAKPCASIKNWRSRACEPQKFAEPLFADPGRRYIRFTKSVSLTTPPQFDSRELWPHGGRSYPVRHSRTGRAARCHAQGTQRSFAHWPAG